jgi:hypothetical protein
MATAEADLEDLVIDRFDFVDSPANQHAVGKMRKRLDAPTSPIEAYNYLMQKASDAVVRVAKSGAVGPTLSQAQHFEKLLTDPNNAAIAKLAMGPVAIREAPARRVRARAPTDAAYDALMLKATGLAELNGTTPAIEFSKLYQSPAEISKRRAKGAPPSPDNSGLTDDDDVDADSGSGEMDDSNEGAELGPPRNPRTLAGRQNTGGKSTGNYERSGVPTMTNGPQAVSGKTESSYNDKARPPSATRKSEKKIRKRIKKFLDANPSASAREAAHYATAPKRARRRVAFFR